MAHSYVDWEWEYPKLIADMTSENEDYLAGLEPEYDYDVTLCSEITMAGKKYINALRFGGADGANTGGMIDFRFYKYRYKYLTFTVGHADSKIMEDSRLSVFLDGKLVLRVKLVYDDLPQTFTMPVRDAKYLKISISNDGYCIVDAKFHE